MHRTYSALNLPAWEKIITAYAGNSGGPYVMVLTESGSSKAFGPGRNEIYHWTDLKCPEGLEFKANNGNAEFRTMSTRVKPATFSSNGSHMVAVRKDGTAVAQGDNSFGQINVSEWNDLIAVGVGDNHTVGLKKDGTAVAVGDNRFGQCDVSTWQDIVNIAVEANHTIGVKSDGTVIAVGENSHGQCNVSGWTNVVDIYTGSCYTIGLLKDGTGIAAGKVNDPSVQELVALDVTNWNNVVTYSNSAFGGTPAVLYGDGTAELVYYSGIGTNEPFTIRKYHHIVNVGCGTGGYLCLRDDGTLVSPTSGFLSKMLIQHTNIVCLYPSGGGSGSLYVLDSSGNLYEGTEFKWENIMIPDWCYDVFDLQS